MKISTAARNAMVDAFTALVDAGSNVYIRTGSAPANPVDSDTGTLLATLAMASTAFGAASSGVATAGAITDETSAPNSGAMGHYRIKNAGAAVVCQGDVGLSGADINFDSVTVTAGGVVAIDSLTVTQPAS